jgi:PAS domain S-box-containing protein
MNGTEFQFACLSDPRLAVHALSPSPAWLWRADIPQILWANPVGAAIFEAASPGAAANISFAANHAAAMQVARLAGTLPAGGGPRLERLRGFGAAFGGALTCVCSRIMLSDNNTAAVLIVATERAGQELSLPERAQRLFADFVRPTAAFTADGELIAATEDARARFGTAADLTELGGAALAREAMRNGKAEGNIAGATATLLKLGAGQSAVALLLAFPAQAGAQVSAEVPVQAGIERPAMTKAVAPESGARRFPLRFVWQMDAANRFTLGTEEFIRLLGPKAAAVLDRPWPEIAAALKLDPQGQVDAALAARDTWSGIVVNWPVDDENDRLPVEMSGLPVFDRERQFVGYRGFGICREVERMAAIERRRTELPTPPEEPANVLPFRAPAPPAVDQAPSLTPGEHSAFQELARELGERLKKPGGQPSGPTTDDFGAEPFVPTMPASPTPAPQPPRATRNGDAARDTSEGRPILDRLPVGILVYRLNNLIYANRAFLDWTGYGSLDELAEAGGLDSLFIETKSDAADARGAKMLTITTVNGNQRPVEGRLFSVAWNKENALVLMLNTQSPPEGLQNKAAEQSLRRIEAENHELVAILDTATDGVLVLDRAGRVLSANRSAEALFGYEAAQFAELSLGDLFAPESKRPVLEYLDRLARESGTLDAGREVIGRVRQGGLVPLYITMGRIADGDKICAVLRDVTAWKRSEEDLINAKQEAERASTAKSEFLAKISHEIRTPLNAIIGFSEVMMDERFGPIGNERYRQYLKDIHTSGGHLISLLNDLLDLSKIEAGKLELTFVSVNVNDLVQQCVAIMQQQANRERVIIRTSLPASLPQVVADTRAVRQIVLNLLSNSIKSTGAGGQVIVSTTLSDDHEVVLRVRDTGAGMSEKELQTALEPFRQFATSPHRGDVGAGLGLPITKALAAANHARFRITSRVEDGTLVEVAFPAGRVLAQ